LVTNYVITVVNYAITGAYKTELTVKIPNMVKMYFIKVLLAILRVIELPKSVL
jgi:hypothetical protein